MPPTKNMMRAKVRYIVPMSLVIRRRQPAQDAAGMVFAVVFGMGGGDAHGSSPSAGP